MRQYKRVRGEKKKKFGYRDVKDVYTIVLFEKSPKEFQDYPEEFYHFFEQRSDTGLQMEFLQKYLFIPLDIFRKSQQNRNIRKKRDAWLALFSSDDPEAIIRLIERYPEFHKIYEEGYEICRNVERVMEMFSKELYELDRNTVQYMIDEMQDTIDAQKEEIGQKQDTIDAQKEEIGQQQDTINAQQKKLDLQEEAIHKMQEKMKKEQEKMYIQGIRNMIDILCSLDMPEQEIILRVRNKYQISEEQARKYL